MYEYEYMGRGDLAQPLYHVSQNLVPFLLRQLSSYEYELRVRNNPYVRTRARAEKATGKDRVEASMRKN